MALSGQVAVDRSVTAEDLRGIQPSYPFAPVKKHGQIRKPAGLGAISNYRRYFTALENQEGSPRMPQVP